MARRILTVPNQITFLRLGFLPFFIIFILYGRYAWALAVLIAAGLSDGLDGLLARHLDQKTDLGAYLDPIADKLLLSSSFFMLALKGKIHWWVTIVVLGRDVLILTTAAVILLVVGYRPFPPGMFGKLTTAVQILLVFVVVSAAAFHHQARGPAEHVGALALSGVHRLAVGHHPAQQEAGGQTSQVGSIVDPADNESKDKNVNHPADQLAANHLHVRAPSARRNGQHQTDQPHQSAGGPDAEVASDRTGEKAGDSGSDIKKQIARRPVHLFHLRPNVHQHPGIHRDVQDAAVEEDGHHKAPPFPIDKDKGTAGTQAVEYQPIDAAE